MAQPMIPCPECGKKHRAAGWEEAVVKCRASREKREAREAAKQADAERRAANWQREKPWELVWRSVREGIAWTNIPARLREAYEKPEPGRDWNLYDVVKMDSVRLLPTWPADLETITLLRLERFHTGEYISMNPLLLDGTFALENGGRQLELPLFTPEQLKDADKQRRADAKAAA